MDNKHSQRRQFMKLGGLALSALPLTLIAARSQAATNAGMRTAMKYQATPSGDKSCSGCQQFKPGKSATDLGGCNLFAGDTEISPKGYCIAWVAKAK